jgi:C-terminal processing protease CtpA/Prc
MAGRFFSERTGHGTAPPLVPTGDWQYDGPVVMLTDEREISSAETFTWAMVETGRAVMVGRPTGGATIIPTTFRAPSGLFSFRMGVHDRKTPIEGVQPEGVGTQPAVFVPYEPKLLQRDPVLAIGIRALRGHVKPIERDETWARLLREHPRNPLPDGAEVEAQSAFEALPDRAWTREGIRKIAKAHAGSRWAESLGRYAR